MNILTENVSPKYYPKGRTTGSLEYIASSENEGPGTVRFKLPDDHRIWFIRDGVKTKEYTHPEEFTKGVKKYTETIVIEVTESINPPLIGYIEAYATDCKKKISSSVINITYG